MGQQQLLLIILGVIIVGVAIAVGISQFGSNAEKSAKDAVLTDLNNIAADAFQFKIRPISMGGGGGRYDKGGTGGGGYVIGGAWTNSPTATYSRSVVDSVHMVVTAVPKAYLGQSVAAYVGVSGMDSIITTWAP